MKLHKPTNVTHETDNDGEFTFQANLTDLPRNTYVPGIGLGIGKCPYDPLDNSTAIYVEKGNPDDLPALVSTFRFLVS